MVVQRISESSEQSTKASVDNSAFHKTVKKIKFVREEIIAITLAQIDLIATFLTATDKELTSNGLIKSADKVTFEANSKIMDIIGAAKGK